MVDIEDDDVVIIYGCGIAGRWASHQLPKVIGFVDSDRKKWGKIFNGIPVYPPSFFDDMDISKVVVVISSVDIFDVIPSLNKKNITRWHALAKILNLDDDLINNTGESDSFLRYSLTTMKNCHEAFLSKESLFIRSVDLVITEKCTLRCKDCANLMQFFEKPRDIELNQIIPGIQRLAEKCDFINEVRVIGGEPFVNKEIYSVLRELLLIDNIGSIVIYSNGMIPPKPDYLELYRNPKVHFSITDYGSLGKNTAKTVSFLQSNDISFRVHPPENWTDSGRIEYQRHTVPELKKTFEDCCGKNLFTLVESRLYRCPFAANADSLGAIPADNQNFVEVGASTESIRRYTREIEFLPACNFCPGRSFDAPEIIPALQVKGPIKYEKISGGLEENGES